MGVEQKIGNYQKTFPFAEIRQAGQHLVVRHKIESGPDLSKTAHSLSKNIFDVGEGFDHVFFTRRQNNRRMTDPSDQIETAYYTSIVARDGSVHQIKSFNPGFQEAFSVATYSATENHPVVYADGFVEISNEGNVSYFLTPPNDFHARGRSTAIWHGLFDQIFWNRTESIEKDILVTISGADNENPHNGQVVVSASYRGESLSIVLPEKSANELCHSLEKPYRGSISFRDSRESQKHSHLLKTPLADF